MTRLLVAAALLVIPALPGFSDVIDVYYQDSIQDGIDSASPGDTLLVHDGTYQEKITLSHRINVWSEHGASATIIDGTIVNADTTVFCPFDADSLWFGGPEAGFTIQGADVDGVVFSGSNAVHVQDLVVDTDASHAGLWIDYCASDCTFEDIRVQVMTGGSARGIVVSYSSVDLETVRARLIDNVGIDVDNCSPEFTSVIVDTCGLGLYVVDGVLSVTGPSEIKGCTTGAGLWGQNWGARLTMDGVDFRYCTTGISAGGVYNHGSWVTLTECTFDDCGDGMILDECRGTVEHCSFSNLDEDGITITDNCDVLTIGGEGSDMVSFDTIDGIGIYVSSGADADIDSCYFSDVEETAIHVESRSDGTTIDHAEMDGDGDCFEGVYTRGSGTLATVRDSRMYDYEVVISPPTPRGACAVGATADLGTRDEWGHNDFHNNTCDLQYNSSLGTPDSLYAVGNWWGESPPAGASFCGQTGYIVYTPYLTVQPKPMPATEPEGPLPEVAKLVGIHPSPSRGDVTFRYALPEGDQVTLDILDLNGRLIRTVVDARQGPGFGSVTWAGEAEGGARAPSGIYVARLTTSDGADAVRFVLVR